MCIIAPSLLEADYKCLGEQLKTMEKSGAEYVHIDVMDGSFVPNLACGMKMIHGLKGVADLVFDVHLMVNEPVRFVKRIDSSWQYIVQGIVILIAVYIDWFKQTGFKFSRKIKA